MTAVTVRPVEARRARRAAARPLVVGIAAGTACVVLVFLALATGPIPIAPAELLQTVLHLTPENDFVVMDLLLPRAVLAVVAGMVLGASGALMQAHTRNPLGTPDIIGFDNGAAAAAVIAIVVLGANVDGIALAAGIGGLLTAILVYLLAGGAHRAGYRLIVTGIAASAALTAVTSYVITRAPAASAIDAQRWLAGSLNDASWGDVAVAGIAALGLLVVGSALRRPLIALTTGDDSATALGVRVTAVQALVVLTAVVASAATVVTVGPVGFVDLVAPQVAVRLARRTGPLVVTAALVGGVLLLTSDLVAQHVVPGLPLPVGIATGVVGGVYLVLLLTRMWRRS